MPSCAVGAGARTDTRRASENAGTEETGTGIGERETGKGEREERETGTGETHGRHGGVTRGETTTIGEGGRQRTIDYRLTASGLTGQTVDPEEQWLTVHMGGSYTDPVVIVGPPSELGGQEAVARIKGLRYQAAGTAHTQYSAGTMVK